MTSMNYISVLKLLAKLKSCETPRITSRLPALGQHIECSGVAVGELIAFHYHHWRQHMPDAVIIEDVTLATFAHGEAVQFAFVIIGDRHFAAFSSAASHEMRGNVLFSVLMQARRVVSHGGPASR